MKKIIVTGANGFLAKTLIQQALKRDILVCGISTSPQAIVHDRYLHLPITRSLNYDSEWLGCEIAWINPDVIFHFAGDPKVNSTDGILESNTLVTNNLLRFCEGCNFVFASSAIVYGSRCPPDGFKVSDRVNPETLYAVTKVQCEELVRYYAKIGAINGLCIRYVATVGRNATHGVLPDVVRKLKGSSEIELFGDYPGSSKPYLWADESMGLTLDLGLSNLEEYSVCNMSPPDSLNIDLLVDEVLRTTGQSPVKKKWNPDAVWKGDQRNLRVQSEFNLLSSREAIRAAVREL